MVKLYIGLAIRLYVSYIWSLFPRVAGNLACLCKVRIQTAKEVYDLYVSPSFVRMVKQEVRNLLGTVTCVVEMKYNIKF